jgi:hypothetical protein
LFLSHTLLANPNGQTQKSSSELTYRNVLLKHKISNSTLTLDFFKILYKIAQSSERFV